MKGYCDNIEKATMENNNFRRVLYTGKHSQLVLMSLQPNEEIGMEVHGKMINSFGLRPDKEKLLLIGKSTK